MTDRELLELAAKASGLFYTEPKWIKVQKKFPTVYLVEDGEWNPLINDGQALRLAVKLGFGISVPLANKRTDVIAFGDCNVSAIEKHGDPYAATRRAIVRAAAEIGRAMS